MKPVAHFALSLALSMIWLVPMEQIRAQDRPKRLNVWDVHIGTAASAIPDEFINYACGTNGGPPSLPLANFAEFKKCIPDANGLREVYFEYDDEYEYIARARDLPREIARWAGTTEAGFPVMVSALFDEAGTGGVCHLTIGLVVRRLAHRRARTVVRADQLHDVHLVRVDRDRDLVGSSIEIGEHVPRVVAEPLRVGALALGCERD